MKDHEFISLQFELKSEEGMTEDAKSFYHRMRQRRTVRDFSDKPVPEEVIRYALLTAGSAPNGANMQPWHFVVIRDAGLKAKIRQAAEAEEKEFYDHRASQEWLGALQPLGTDEIKPYLTTAPVLIAVFQKKFTIDGNGVKRRNYYVNESVGIATGFLITALHLAGLAALTYTPSPMKFLNKLLDRPEHEKPFMMVVTGFPAQDARVPRLEKYPLENIATFL